MTAIRWSILFFSFLFPTATDLLFCEVSSLWLMGCTIVAFIWNFFCGWSLQECCLCLIPGSLLWLLARFCNGIGMGDVFSAFLIGAICGINVGLEILLGGSIVCFFGQLICMAVRIVGRKKEQKNKEKKAEQKICTAKEERKEVQTQNKMPFVPWLLLSIFANWLFQKIPI